MEIRGGTGGDEAAIFAGDLFRMYSKFCEAKGWKIAISSCSEGTSGGFKEIIFSVTGTKVYGTLKYESGVHRVQRVPQTETQGRIQTSAASVAVFPEAGEFDVDLSWDDIRLDLFCSSGPGGQGVNTTYFHRLANRFLILPFCLLPNGTIQAVLNSFCLNKHGLHGLRHYKWCSLFTY